MPLKKAGTSTVATTIASLLVKIGVEFKEVNKGVKGVEKKLTGLKGSFKKFQQTSLLVWGAIGAVAVKSLQHVSQAAVDFETDLTHLGNVTGATVGELAKVGQQTQKLGTQFGVSSNEIVHGLTELTKLGYSTADSLKAMPQLLKFTVANGTSFSNTVRLM